MTFLDLQTRVKTRVIDLPPAVSAEVPKLINEAIRSAQRKYNFRAMERSTTLVTTTLSFVPTPNTLALFKEYKDKGPYILQNLARAKRELITTADDAALDVLSDINNPDEPDYLTSTVDPTTGVYTMSVYPYPDQLSDWPDGNYRIVVPYYAYSTPLVADGDTNWFVDNMDDYIYREATGQAFGLDWDYQSMTLWLQQSDVKYQEAKKADKMHRLGGVDQLVPMWQGANQPQVRR